MSKILKAFTLAVCVCAISATETSAQNVYEYLFSQSTYTAANAGDAVTVVVKLRETATNGSLARLAPPTGDDGMGNIRLPEDGLIQFGLNLDFGTVTGGSGSLTDASRLSFVDATPTNFNSFDLVVTANPTDITVSDLENFGPDAEADGIGVNGTLVQTSGTTTIYELDLFSFEFTAGDIGSVTRLELSNAGGEFVNQFSDFTVIDDDVTFTPSQIVVGAAVPEPSSLMALGVLMMGGTLRRRRG